MEVGLWLLAALVIRKGRVSVISLWLLAVALRSIPVGTAYAVWTGIGAVGVAVLGMVLFGESREFLRIFCLFLIIAGIVGLKVVS